MYNPNMVQPMREELTALGIEELLTPEHVDTFMGRISTGTAMVVVNSVCGCAAGGARPGVALALKHAKRPSTLATVFAGQDKAATERARSYFTGQPPSSPAVAIFKDGKLVHMLHRNQIEGKRPQEIAAQLTHAFDTVL
jgi:putative YphP/YqiW family bacilliredoxin